MIQPKQRGARFTIQANVGVAGASAQRAEIIRVANSAITATPR